MPKRKVLHVVPGDKGWKVKEQGKDRSLKNFERKEDAVDFGREKAKGADLGQLKIHRKDGKIQTEYTYGKDPYPPKG